MSSYIPAALSMKFYLGLKALILFSIQVFGGGKELTTQLYFQNDVPPSYEDYVANRSSQFPQKVQATSSGRTITFDLVMDV